MNKRGLYTVPDLPVKDIITYFGEVDIEIATADVLRPTPPATQRIYDAVLELFVGAAAPAADESLQIIKQVQRMGNFLMKIGLHNFTIRDFSPDSRRLIQILSVIINFGMYRDSKRQVYERVSQIADTNYVARKDLETGIARTKEEIQEVLEKLEKNASHCRALEEETQKLENELRDFYKHQKDKVSEVGLLKAEKAEIADKLCSCQLLVYNLKQEIACLRTQVVNDPTKLLELVEEMRLLIDKEKESIREIEAGIEEGNARHARLVKTGEAIAKVGDVIRELNATDDKIERMDQNSILLESKQKNLDSSINAVKIRMNHIDRQVSHLESKIYNLQNNDKKLSEEISGKISNLKIKYDSISEERQQMMEKVRRNNKMIQELMYEKAKAAGEHDRDCSEIVSLLVQLNGQIDSYFSELGGCFSE